MDNSLRTHRRKGTGKGKEQGTGNRELGGLPAIAHQATHSGASTCGYVENLDTPALLDVDQMVRQIMDVVGTRHPIVRSGAREPISWPTRLAVLHRDDNRCKRCGAYVRHQPAHLDHIRPWSAGGSDRTHNLRTFCASCNQKRSNFHDGSENELLPATWWCGGCTAVDQAAFDRILGVWIFSRTPNHHGHCWACEQSWSLAVQDSRVAWPESPFAITDYAADPVLAYCAHCDATGYTRWPL